MMGEGDVLARAEGLVEQAAGEERVLVPLRADMADFTRLWTLNRTGSVIWGLLDGQRTVGEVVDAVVARYRTERDDAAPQVAGLLQSLLDAGLVRRVSPPPGA